MKLCSHRLRCVPQLTTFTYYCRGCYILRSYHHQLINSTQHNLVPASLLRCYTSCIDNVTYCQRKSYSVHNDSGDEEGANCNSVNEERCSLTENVDNAKNEQQQQQRNTRVFSSSEVMELNRQASDDFNNGNYSAAIEIWEAIVSNAASTQNTTLLMNCLNNLACAYGEMGNNKHKWVLLERARALVEGKYGKAHPQYGLVLYNMACAKEELGEYDEMKQLLLESLHIHEGHFSPTHAKVGRVLLQLTRAYGYCNEPKAQLESAQRALAIIRGHCGVGHAQTANAMMALADALGANGNVARQLQQAEKVMEMLENTLGERNPQLAPTYMSLALAYRVNGDHVNEREYLERSIALQKRGYGGQHVHLVNAYCALGDAFGSLERVDEQIRCYLEAYKIARQRFAGKHVMLGMAMTKAALAYFLKGDKSTARELLVTATDIITSNVTPHHPASAELRRVRSLIDDTLKLEEHETKVAATDNKCQ